MAEEQLKGTIVFSADTDELEVDVKGLADRLQGLLEKLSVGKAEDKGRDRGPSAVGIGVVSGITTAVTQSLLRGLGRSVSSLTGLVIDFARGIATASPSMRVAFSMFSIRMRLLALQIGERLSPAIGGLLDIVAKFVESVNFELVAERVNDFALTVMPKLSSAMETLGDTIGTVVGVLANQNLSTFEMLQALRDEFSSKPGAALDTGPSGILGGLFRAQKQLAFIEDPLFKKGEEPVVDAPKKSAPTEQKANASDTRSPLQMANQFIINPLDTMRDTALKTMNKIEYMRQMEREAKQVPATGLEF